MKRWLVAIAAFALLCTVGCGLRRPREARVADFSCRIEATMGDLSLSGTLTRYTAGTLELAFDKPEMLKGLTALWDGNVVTLQMLGLEFDVDPASVPESALGNEIVGVLDQVLKAEVEGKTKGETLVFEGTLNGHAYTLVCNGESGLPQSLSMPARDLYAKFITE